jgi:hypothetical protein
MDARAVGKVYPDVGFVVEPERVAAFRDAFGLHHGVPPTFATAAEFQVLPQVAADPELGLDLSRVLHGSQSYELARPLVEGERLTVRTTVESIRRKGQSTFLVLVSDLIGADGAVAVRARNTLIERGVPGEGADGDPRGGPA